MNITHLTSLGIQCIAYLLMTLSFYGWGLCSFHLTGLGKDRSKVPYHSVIVWSGVFTTVLYLLAIHLFFPLRGFAVIPWWILGVCISICYILKTKIQFHKPDFKSICYGVFFVLIIGYVASRSMLTPIHNDSGLYHFQTIRWINEYPIVRGLGNLHGRLAFNQSIFPFTAALNIFPYFGKGYSLTNSYLLLLLFFAQIEMIWPWLRQGTKILQSPPEPLEIFSLLSLPVLGWWMIYKDISSPTTDFASALIQFQVFILYLRFIFFSDVHKHELYTLFWLSGLLTTTKLSNVAFCASMLTITLVLLLKNKSSSFREIFWLIFPPGLMAGLMMVRGYLLSGAPLYPSSIGYIEFTWSVPMKDVIYMHDEILAWARKPWTPVYEVLGNWDWVPDWVKTLNYYRSEVLWPVFISTFSAIGILFSRIYYRKKSPAKNTPLFLSIAPLLLGLLFWFLTAPDPRFANATFQLIPLLLLGTVFLTLKDHLTHLKTYLLLIGILILQNMYNAARLTVEPSFITNVSTSGWQPLPSPVMREWTNLQGVRFLRTVRGDKAWDSPLPNSPFRLKNIELLDTEDLGTGFRMPEGYHTHYRAPVTEDTSTP